MRKVPADASAAAPVGQERMEDQDYASQLAERANIVITALREMGIAAQTAADAGGQYINWLSKMVTDAHNIAFFGRKVPDVLIGDIEPDDLRTVVTRNGREWGKIWLARSDPPKFQFESDTEDPEVHIKGDFEVSSQ